MWRGARNALTTSFVAGFVMLASCKKTQSAEPVLTKCQADADCTYVTKGRGDCCVNPCGGAARAVHNDEAAAIASYNAESCTAAVQKQCPQAGACAQPTRAPAAPAKCVGGGCVEGT